METSVSNLITKDFIKIKLILFDREEEDPDEYPFPLSLRPKKQSGPGSPDPIYSANGTGET